MSATTNLSGVRAHRLCSARATQRSSFLGEVRVVQGRSVGKAKQRYDVIAENCGTRRWSWLAAALPQAWPCLVCSKFLLTRKARHQLSSSPRRRDGPQKSVKRGCNGSEDRCRGCVDAQMRRTQGRAAKEGQAGRTAGIGRRPTRLWRWGVSGL